MTFPNCAASSGWSDSRSSAVDRIGSKIGPTYLEHQLGMRFSAGRLNATRARCWFRHVLCSCRTDTILFGTHLFSKPTTHHIPRQHRLVETGDPTNVALTDFFRWSTHERRRKLRLNSLTAHFPALCFSLAMTST